MLALRTIQANYGDCFILEFGAQDDPKYLLIDGGPRDTYSRHLRRELAKIGEAGARLELAMISHVDTDHLVGVLDFAAELQAQQAGGEAPLVELGGLWMNSFEKAIVSDTDIDTRLARTFATTPDAAGLMANAQATLLGLGEGNRLRVCMLQLGIPLNHGFPGELVCVDDHPDPVQMGNLSLRIVGPTRANLDALRDEWLAWLEAKEESAADPDARVMKKLDDSVPNLSSIMVLAEADGKSILFTGDGRGDHLEDGLRTIGLLEGDGPFHVDVLKVPHHGSDRNASRKFFRTVTADVYVVSANGHPDNPDLSTLSWIVEAARQQGRHITIKATNDRWNLTKLVQEYPPAEYGYDLEVMPDHYHYWLHPLA